MVVYEEWSGDVVMLTDAYFPTCWTVVIKILAVNNATPIVTLMQSKIFIGRVVFHMALIDDGIPPSVLRDLPC